MSSRNPRTRIDSGCTPTFSPISVRPPSVRFRLRRHSSTMAHGPLPQLLGIRLAVGHRLHPLTKDGVSLYNFRDGSKGYARSTFGSERERWQTNRALRGLGTRSRVFCPSHLATSLMIPIAGLSELPTQVWWLSSSTPWSQLRMVPWSSGRTGPERDDGSGTVVQPLNVSPPPGDRAVIPLASRQRHKRAGPEEPALTCVLLSGGGSRLLVRHPVQPDENPQVGNLFGP